MQGRLRGERISASITTECAHCQQPIHLEVDSEFNYRVEEADARPLIFAPLKVVRKGAPSIIDCF